MPTILRLRFVLALAAVVFASAAFIAVRHVERAGSSNATAEATAQAQKLELEHIDVQAMRNIRIPANYSVASTARCDYPCWVVHRSSANVARQLPSIFRSAGAVPYPKGRLANGCGTVRRWGGTYTLCDIIGTIDGQPAWIASNPLATCVSHHCRIGQETLVEFELPGMVAQLPGPRPQTPQR